MKKIEHIAQLSPLINAQFRRGVMTNAPFSPDAYQAELNAGALYAQEIPGGLLLLCRREGFDQLHFYLQPDADLSQWSPARTTVAEILSKPANPNGQRLDTLWTGAGFYKQLVRQRMTCTELTHSGFLEGYTVREAGQSEISTVLELLNRHYDRRTAYIPTREDLCRDIENGNVVLALAGETPVGVLHMTKNRAATELRHVAVEPDHRGKGLAGAMAARYQSRHVVPTYQLWVAQDNGPALRLYEKLGFKPDGWTSTVWMSEQKGNE